MASLTKVSIISRKAIRYSIYFVILALIARFSINTGVELYKRYNPEPPPPPTVGFGRLSGMPFPEKEFPKGLKFTIETPEGGLPNLADQLPVYFMPRLTSSLAVLDEAQRKATSLGFNANGRRLVANVPNIYVFERSSRPQTLLVNIITGTFSISYDLTTDRSILSGIPPSNEAAIEAVKRYLGRNLADDISRGRETSEYKKIQAGVLVDAESLSEAELTKVNLFRKNFTELNIPSMTHKAVEANVWFNVASGNNIVNGEYHYYPISEDRSETYPLISAQAAFEKLNEGEAFIANMDDPENKDIVIRRIYLAYYDAGQYSEFYQPVVVFQGDDNFFAYVPAVTSEYYGE